MDNSENRMQGKFKVIVVLISVSVYCLCLYLPAVYLGAETPVRGVNFLLMGWLGLISGDIFWLANCTYFVAVFKLVFNKAPVERTVSQLLLLSFFLAGAYLFYYHSVPIDNIGDVPREIRLGIGYFLWLLSFLVPLIGYAVLDVQKKHMETFRRVMHLLGFR